jgi:hypothetical protein
MAKQKHLEKQALLKLAVFGALFVVSVGLSFIGLSMNSQEAKQRYDSLIAVDKAGGDVPAALDELRVYIYSHMNTQIGSDTGIRPPIQLQGTYQRIVAERELEAGQTNEELYAQAQSDCELRNPNGFSGSNRLDCIAAYVDANGVSEGVDIVVEDDLYKFDFASPRWSPDLAGFSIVFSIVFGVLTLIDTIIYFHTKNIVKYSQ